MATLHPVLVLEISPNDLKIDSLIRCAPSPRWAATTT